jgi:hypothetical protein
MQTKRFLVLLVVLALSSLFLSGIADSAVRTMDPSGPGEVPGGVVFKDGGGSDGGDDDRWGDSSPSVPGEDDPQPEMSSGTPGNAHNVAMRQVFTGGELWSVQVRFLLSSMLIRF